MKKTFVFILLSCLFCNQILAQAAGQAKAGDVNKIYTAAEKQMLDGNFLASLETLKREAGSYLSSSDSLLYLKIKLLEFLFPASAIHTRDLDSTLKLFMRKVNKYSFSEQKYAEIGRINSQFLQFKERDKIFYDSIGTVARFERVEELAGIKRRIDDYLQITPGSLYAQELNTTSKNISNELARLEKIRKKAISDSTSRIALKRFGKGTVLNIGYNLPGANAKAPFTGLHGYNDALDFFSGRYKNGLGTKYSVNASLFNAMFNIYTSSRVKASIDWNIFDAEYTVFDWSRDTLLKDGPGENTLKNKELKSVKAGTRIGPTLTMLLNRKIAVSIYYSARPGVQFILGDHYFSLPKGSGKEEYSLEPDMLNYNLSNEVGLKFRFFKTLYINPYVHFGKYTWKHEIKNLYETAGGKTVKANYPFTFLGFRLGF
jgi:hypothetical protein